LARSLQGRAGQLFAGIAALPLFFHLATADLAQAEDVVTDQAGFAAAVEAALEDGQPDTITAQGGSVFVSGSDWVFPGNAADVSITFKTSPFQIGNADADAALTLQSGSLLTVNTTSGSSLGRIEIGNGGTGTLTISGGTLQVNLADTSTLPGTSIGRIWVGGGATNTTGGTGTLAITSGELLFAANAGSLNYGALAVGRGGGVNGTVTQSGGTVRFSSAGALDLGTHGGTGSYVMSGDAVFDASSGGMTAYIGSRTSGAGGSGTASTGSLTISDDAQFSITTGSFSGGSLYVGDSKGTGTITQDGAGSSVTLTLANPIKFGSDQVSYGTGGTGTYNLSAGTLTVGNGGGTSQIVFGAASGGSGTFNISGGSADIAAPLILASVAGATGTVNLTGGTLTLSGSSYLSFGSGTGTFNLDGGTLTVGGTNGIRGTGTFNFGGGTLKVGSSLTTSNAMTLTSGKTATIDTNGNSATLSGVLSGSGALQKTGTGTLTLSGDNTYSGGTTVSGGTLSIAADSALGDAAGGITLADASLITGNATFASARAVSLSGSATIGTTGSGKLTLSGIISGTGALAKISGGTLILSGTNTYTGGTTFTAGTLQVGADANLGDAAGGLTINGGTLATTASFTSGRALTFTNSGTFQTASDTTLTLTGAITGYGTITKTGDGTLVLTGSNTENDYGASILAGTLQIGNGGTSGALLGDVINEGALVFNRSDDTSFIGFIDGSGSLTQAGSGKLTLSFENTYTGLTTVAAGTLDITGGVAGDAAVQGGATLMGSGSVAGTVTVADGGTLSGAQGAGLTMGGLSLSSGSNLDVTLGATTAGGVFTVNGDLTLDGTLNVTRATDFGAGVYSIISYTGTLTDNGLELASLASGFGGLVQTAQAGEVNLVVEGADASIQFWNGSTTTATGSVAGGAGTWTAGATSNWTSAGGLIPQAANGGFAVFQGTAGTVTIDDAEGSVTANGMQFVTSGYTLTGDALTLTGTGSAAIRVGDGTELGATKVATIASELAGTVGLDKTDYGTLVLTGANTYSGGTTISAGTLQIGADSALGDSSGGLTIATGTLATTATFSSARAVSLTGDATIDTADATSLTLSGAISGAGSLTKSGTGTLIITGDGSFIGTTTIAAGTLQIGNGGTTGSISGDIVNNAHLVINRSDDYTIASSITGSGTLTLSGGGTATFGSSYSGNVTVQDAKAVLASGSTTAADYVIGNDGVLGGSATIGSLTVNVGGTVAPGYSPGTLTVAGPVTFNSGSIYSVDVAPDGSHDLIVATGDVTLSTGASVEVVAAGGTYAPKSKVTILSTSGTVIGTFGGVTSNLAFLTPTLSYDAKSVYLELVYTGTSIVSYARTPNQTQVAGAVQALANGNAVFDAVTLLSTDAVAPALDQLSGEIYPSINAVIQQQSVQLRDVVGTRLRQVDNGDGARALSSAALSAGPDTVALTADRSSVAWAESYGALGATLGNQNAGTISSAVGGLLVGADAALSDTIRAGVVVGYGGTQLDVDGRGSSGSVSRIDLGAYAGAQFAALGLRAGAVYSWHEVDVNRTIALPGFADRQSASYGSGALQIFGEASYRLAFAGYQFEPFAGLAYVNLSGGSARESGTGAAGLTVDIRGQQTLYTTLGGRLATSLDTELGTVTPNVTLGWQHAFGDTDTSASMQLGPTSFTIGGVPFARDTLILGAGLAYEFSDSVSLEVNYAGQLAETASQHAVTARLSGRF